MKMSRSAENDPEVKRLLKELEDLGYQLPLPKHLGKARARKFLRTVISTIDPTICPVCGRKIKE